MEEHRIASEDEFDGEGSRVIAEIMEREIAVFYLNGDYYAVSNYCVHAGGPLCEGEVTGQLVRGDPEWDWISEDGDYIRCPWHGWTFDITTGVNRKDNRYTIPTYETTTRDGDVFVKL